MSHVVRSSFALAFLVAAAPLPAQARKCPNIMIVLDRSGSMSSDPNGGGNKPNKWDLSVMAINAALTKYGDRLAFGLEMFTSNGGGNACYTDTKVDINVDKGTATQIKALLAMSQPSGGTNTGEAIKRAYVDGNLKDMTRGNYIILITDGDPNCNGGEPTYTNSEIAAAAMLKPSIHTFVVGFDGSGGVNPKNLNDMAKAGLEPIPGCDPNANPPKPCYYSASNAQKFLTAIDSIIGLLAGGSLIGGCDDTCFSNGCPNNQICGIPRGQTMPSCFPDPCGMVQCPVDAFCKEGQCIMPCPPCDPMTEVCKAGSCVPDACAGVQCPNGQACDKGKCVADKCVQSNPNCSLPLYCDPVTGNCVDDACRLVNCPANSTCYNGYCMTDPPPAPPPDMTMEQNIDLTWEPIAQADLAKTNPNNPGNKGGTCSVGGGTEGAGPGLLLACVLGALLLRRRRAA